LQLDRGGFPVVAGKGKAKKEEKQGALHGLGLDTTEFAQKYGRNVGGMGVWWENYLGYALSSIKQWGKNIYVTHLQVDFINPSGLLYQPVKIRFLLGMPVFL
jgi:hypothetical protein